MSWNRWSLYLVAIAVLVPTTVATAPLTFFGFVTAWEMLSRGFSGPAATWFVVLTLGGLGVASMWVLFFHFLTTQDRPSRVYQHYAALAAGTSLSVLFISKSHGAFVFYGWPLLGAGYFLVRLILAPRRLR